MNLVAIVIMKELRSTLGIEQGTPMEIFTEGENIVLKKYAPGCIFCDSLENVTEFKGKHVCTKCRKEV